MPLPHSGLLSLRDLSQVISVSLWFGLRRNASALISVVILSTLAGGQTVTDREIADKVFSMANAMRVAAGVAPLQADQRISDAATLHVIEFAKAGTPADQYGDEPWLLERLRMAEVRSGAAGEILLKFADMDHLPDQMKANALMTKILLDPKFTLAGFAATVNGPTIYVVGNFLQLLENLSIEQVEDLVVEVVQQRRVAKKIMPFKVVPMHQLHGLACEMAKKDSLKVSPVSPYVGKFIVEPSNGNFFTLTFVTSDPRNLPNSIQGPTGDPTLNALSVGVCFGTTHTYPSGMYWVAMEIYSFRSGPRD